jgi:hypothetical protein
MEWVFVVWFLLQDGSIPKPEVRGPFATYELCSHTREAFRFTPTRPTDSVGYILTSCRTQVAVAKEAQRKP